MFFCVLLRIIKGHTLIAKTFIVSLRSNEILNFQIVNNLFNLYFFAEIANPSLEKSEEHDCDIWIPS